MNNILIALVLLVASFSAANAEPWVITGQTSIPANTGVDNPTPANTGALGAVTALPYTVPAGCTLLIDAYGMEGYDAAGISVLFIWTGAPDPATSQWRIDHGAASVAADSGSQEITGQKLYFPEGTVINVRLINGTTMNNTVFGWYVNGDLDCS